MKLIFDENEFKNLLSNLKLKKQFQEDRLPTYCWFISVRK